MLYNIIQIVAFQALFLLVYDLVFRKETFFNYNRAYLLITSLLSLILPFLKLPELQSVTTKDFVIQLPEVLIGAETITENEIKVAELTGIIIEEPSQPLWQLILIIGVSVASIIFLLKLAKIFWMRYHYPNRWKRNVLVIKLIESTKVFSFFNMIFLGDRIPEKEQSTIYNHELVHIRELHSIDLLYFEILRIVLWFNPLVYVYQNRIKELHEFIADAKAVKHHGASTYYQALLNQIFDVNNVSFTNTFFNKSLIKKRIAMLQKSRSKQMNLIKYTLLLPIVLGMLIYTSTEVRAQQSQEASNSYAQEPTEEELIKKYYNEIVAMHNNGTDFSEISDYAGIGKKYLDRYVFSKEEFLKSKAYMQFAADDMIRRKSEEGTLNDKDVEMANKMKLGRTYAEHREWLKTKDSKDRWESYARDGQLRLVVDDLDNKTKEEQKRFDALLDQLNNDKNFDKLIVCEAVGGSRIELFDSEKNNVIEKEESIEVPFSVIDQVPTIADCKDLATNTERKKCMSQYIAKQVNKNFNIGLADSLGITGRQRIFVAFKIDEQGLVKDVKARASRKEFEIEASRVIKTLPQMIPGKHKGETVVVPYSLPIVFQITGKKETSNSQKNSQLMELAKAETVQNLENLREQRDRILQNSSENNPIVVLLNKKIDSLRQNVLESVRKKELENSNTSTKNDLSEIPLNKIELAPTHPDCKTLEGNEERKKCTSAAVSKFVNANFNTKLTKSLNLANGRHRIIVKFMIDENGDIKNTEALGSHEKMQEEALRVINLLPQFVPGEHEGKKVSAPFTLPIHFQLANTTKNKD